MIRVGGDIYGGQGLLVKLCGVCLQYLAVGIVDSIVVVL